jgi:hypothetical protein
MTRPALLALSTVLAATPGMAQEPAIRPHTSNTLTAPASVPSPPAALRDLAWLAGDWHGTGLGGQTDEAWSAPAGGAMMGMFRLVRDGKVVFYEFLTLVEHEGSLLLKLKHFNPDLTGWEEKANFVTFRLLKTTPDAAYFGGLTFRRAGADRLEIFLALRDSATGTLREERFALTRRR